MTITSSLFFRLHTSGNLIMTNVKESSCLMAMIVTFCLLGINETASATNYFNWGVESLRVNYGAIQGSFDVQWFGGTTLDCAVSHSGNCSMRLNVVGNDSGNQQMG